MINISVRVDVKRIERSLSNLAYQQMPFATAKALTALAKIVQKGEQVAMGSVFDRPTPFTVNAVGVRAARKDNLEALVFVKDIAAAYLEPYEFGGSNKLNSRALLKPVGAPLNQYGNLAKTKLSQLKAKGNTFVGKVKGKGGQQINGVWQRIPAGKGKPASMKLLIRFGDAHKATQHLDYRKRAELLVRTHFNRELGIALARAIATAR
ncbi:MULTISPECIES: hypothetical protein [unclassified Variovorax]|uniref:hypothetical protein n=1 Tax=unclassified Variovorax TaxID=663243 RepID=UPI00076CE6D1|nr:MULTISPECIES: hypothetical protein [unclassified Variovorax]KWT89340.1 hypothetical protein APY03_3419 [Variovorax sp. WDL1]PNG56517.1 hypothetical protein CHC07_02936 [Variovorax sp. B4]PNG57941.1 hypothetical protein CHC06_02939 [Variovorax sp. B2]VTV09594.1 hypothetical protein WDL1CHR_00687 [Variovorax sp. WDL1]